MANKDRNRDNAGWRSENDELGHELDAALAKYAAVEPRPGLVERVLANLRADQARVPDRVWWRWSVVGALSAMVVVALTVAWRSSKPSHPVVASHPSTTTQGTKEPATQVVSNGGSSRVRPSAPTTPRKIAAFIASAQPKLDQFPSPQPLNEQEKMLQNYVAKYPEQAVLIARARTEELRRDEIERMKAFASGDRATDSEEPNSDTTER